MSDVGLLKNNFSKSGGNQYSKMTDDVFSKSDIAKSGY
jgi:hypothetical protein